MCEWCFAMWAVFRSALCREIGTFILFVGGRSTCIPWGHIHDKIYSYVYCGRIACAHHPHVRGSNLIRTHTHTSDYDLLPNQVRKKHSHGGVQVEEGSNLKAPLHASVLYSPCGTQPFQHRVTGNPNVEYSIQEAGSGIDMHHL